MVHCRFPILQASYAPWLAPTISVLASILLIDAGLSICSLVRSGRKQDGVGPAGGGVDEESNGDSIATVSAASLATKLDKKMTCGAAVKGSPAGSPMGHLQPLEVSSPVHHEQISTEVFWSPMAASEELAVPTTCSGGSDPSAAAGASIGRFRGNST